MTSDHNIRPRPLHLLQNGANNLVIIITGSLIIRLNWVFIIHRQCAGLLLFHIRSTDYLCPKFKAFAPSKFHVGFHRVIGVLWQKYLKSESPTQIFWKSHSRQTGPYAVFLNWSHFPLTTYSNVSCVTSLALPQHRIVEILP